MIYRTPQMPTSNVRTQSNILFSLRSAVVAKAPGTPFLSPHPPLPILSPELWPSHTEVPIRRSYRAGLEWGAEIGFR